MKHLVPTIHSVLTGKDSCCFPLFRTACPPHLLQISSIRRDPALCGTSSISSLIIPVLVSHEWTSTVLALYSLPCNLCFTISLFLCEGIWEGLEKSYTSEGFKIRFTWIIENYIWARLLNGICISFPGLPQQILQTGWLKQLNLPHSSGG